MKKSSRTKQRSRAALAAAAIALPMLGGMSEADAQKPVKAPTVKRTESFTIKQMSVKGEFKFTPGVAIVGIDTGRIIYRNKSGELFYLEPTTGDMKFIKSTGPAIKRIATAHKDRIAQKISDKTLLDVAIVGADEKGNLLHKTTAGDTFFLDPATGDMIFVR